MIYEGANGVQALDLVGRKLGAGRRQADHGLLRRWSSGFIKENEADERLKAGFLDPLKAASKDLQSAASSSCRTSRTPNAALAGSTDFLHLFGHVCLGYMWARMAKAALGRAGRLPRSQARHRALLHGPAPAGDRAAPRPHPVGRRAGDGASRGGVLMAEYKLHCFAQSGNSYKVALMLALSDADWEPVWVDFFHGEHPHPRAPRDQRDGRGAGARARRARAHPVGRDPRLPRPALPRLRPEVRGGAARDPALDCSGTTTSSPPTSRACAS